MYVFIYAFDLLSFVYESGLDSSMYFNKYFSFFRSFYCMHAWVIQINVLFSRLAGGFARFFEIEERLAMNNDNLMKRIPLIYRLKGSSVVQSLFCCLYDMSVLWYAQFLFEMEISLKRKRNAQQNECCGVGAWKRSKLMIKRSHRWCLLLDAMNALKHR